MEIVLILLFEKGIIEGVYHPRASGNRPLAFMSHCLSFLSHFCIFLLSHFSVDICFDVFPLPSWKTFLWDLESPGSMWRLRETRPGPLLFFKRLKVGVSKSFWTFQFSTGWISSSPKSYLKYDRFLTSNLPEMLALTIRWKEKAVSPLNEKGVSQDGMKHFTRRNEAFRLRKPFLRGFYLVSPIMVGYWMPIRKAPFWGRRTRQREHFDGLF